MIVFLNCNSEPSFFCAFWIFSPVNNCQSTFIILINFQHYINLYLTSRIVQLKFDIRIVAVGGDSFSFYHSAKVILQIRFFSNPSQIFEDILFHMKDYLEKNWPNIANKQEPNHYHCVARQCKTKHKPKHLLGGIANRVWENKKFRKNKRSFNGFLNHLLSSNLLMIWQTEKKFMECIRTIIY